MSILKIISLDVLFGFYKGIHKNVSYILTAYIAIFFFLFGYLLTFERNNLNALILKQIAIEKSQTQNEKQRRQYLIVIMFQQVSITLMLFSIPVGISLFQFSRLNIKKSKRKAFNYPQTLRVAAGSFSQRLISIFPRLTISDIKLCELLIQNLSSKEISFELNIAPASVNTARYRLRKKLNIPVDQDLLTFLKKI